MSGGRDFAFLLRTASPRVLYAWLPLRPSKTLFLRNMSDDIPEVELLSTYEQSDVDMVADSSRRSSPSAQAELAGLTSLSLADKKKPRVYVEVTHLPPTEKEKYATDLAERPVNSDEEFPEEQIERVIGEYDSASGLYYFVRMSSGEAFKVRDALAIKLYVFIQHSWTSFQQLASLRSSLSCWKNMVSCIVLSRYKIYVHI